MSTKKTTTDETAEVTTETTATTAEKKFTVKKLKQYSRKVFGVSTVTFAGATASLDEDALYTIDEMKTIINAWKNTKITKEAK